MLRVNNLSAGAGGFAVVPTDDGDFAPTSGTSSSAHTFASMTSTGPASVVLIMWNALSVRTISTITFDGNSMTELHEAGRSTGLLNGCAIYIINGAQSGDIVATFSGAAGDSHITIVSLANLRSLTAIDVDDAGASSGTGTAMTALTNPGGRGIVLAVYANDGSATAVTWTNATEIADLDMGLGRHSASWVLGDPAGNLIADGANNDHQLVGVSLR